MGKKKSNKTYVLKPFESAKSHSDPFAAIYLSMIISKAWAELTAQQRQLYLYCKLQTHCEKPKPDKENDLSFTMNQSKWSDIYQLYKKNNARSFQRDITALIQFGFIECIQCGAISRTKSIYQFSSMWQKYDTNDFVISKKVTTLAMDKKAKKDI